MPRSSRHKSLKQTKHSSKEYPDSEDDVRKVKERSSKDENSIRSQLDSTSGAKRKSSSQVRKDRDRKDSSIHGNGEVLEEFASSKRRKEKSDDFIDGDRWNGGVDEKDINDRFYGKEVDNGGSLKSDEKHKDKNNKGEILKSESRNKSRRNEIVDTTGRKEEGSASVLVEKEENKSRSESKRKSDRDPSYHKEGRNSKDREHLSKKESNGGRADKNCDDEVKLIDSGSRKKQEALSGNLVEDRQHKRSRDNTDGSSQNVLQSPEPKEYEKKIHRKREGSDDREKHLDYSKEGDESHESTRSGRLKDMKHKDEKYKDAGFVEKYPEDHQKSDQKKDEKYRDGREDVEKDSKHRYYKCREDGDRDSRHKDEKYREDGESKTKPKDEKYGKAKEDGRVDKYRDDGVGNKRRIDDRYHENGPKVSKSEDDRYPEDGHCDDNRRGDGYGDDGARDNKHKDEKCREDFAKDDRRKDSIHGNEIGREKRQRESRYEHSSKDRSGDKRPIDDKNRRIVDEKENNADTKSRSTKDQRSDAERRSSRMDSISDRERNTSRQSDADHSRHSRRRSSPTSSSHGLRDNYRSLKQEESSYRDYNYEERHRDSNPSTREHMISLGGSEKAASLSLEKLDRGDDSQPPELSVEKRLKSDNHSSPLKRPGSSRDQKEGRGSRDLAADVVPGEENLQIDTDMLSVSSPFIKNNHFTGSSKSLPPVPSFRIGVDSSLPLVLAEDDGKNKPHSRDRRIGDPNMGRIPGNAWRGVPSWPSPMSNGFSPYPHGPPHVGFHSIMQPFPVPPIFGVRPPMELNPHFPFHMSDTCPPMNAWNGSGYTYGDESHIYGRPDWDQSQHMPVGQVLETSDDMWKGSDRTKSLERGNEAGQSLPPFQCDQTQVDHLAKTFEQNDAVVPPNSLECRDVIAKKARKDDVCSCCKAYLSKLDISADLAEPELFAKFKSLLSIDQNILYDDSDSKILYVEAEETKELSHSSLYVELFPSIDDSILQKSVSLYKKQKQTLQQPKHGSKVELFFEMEPKSNQDNNNDTYIKAENPCPTDDMQGLEDGFSDRHLKPNLKNASLKAEEHIAPVAVEEKMIDECAGGNSEKTDEPMSSVCHVKTEENDTDKDPSSEGCESASAFEVKNEHRELEDEAKLLDTKFGALLNSEMVTLSRIHHSPESTH